MSETVALVPADLVPGLVPAGLADDVLERALASSDPAWLWNGATSAAAYAAKWKRYGADTTEFRRAQLYCEISLGQVLGPRPGYDRRLHAENGDFLPAAYSHANMLAGVVPAPRVSELQQFYGLADALIAAVRDGRVTSRRQLLRYALALAEPADAAQQSGPPDSRQHFDVWAFASSVAAGADPTFFGAMPAEVVENVLWFWTEPGDVVVDPFAGGGTTIHVARRMGRRLWASDLHPSTTRLPIAAHDITTGWPSGAPDVADLILLDPPYWKQAKGRYSDDPRDLGNQTLTAFMSSWWDVINVCREHLAPDGRLAYIVSPTQDTDRVVDHAFDMYRACVDAGLACERRVIVTYQTQQATGQQVEWAREHRQLLKRYRDLVVMRAS